MVAGDGRGGNELGTALLFGHGMHENKKLEQSVASLQTTVGELKTALASLVGATGSAANQIKTGSSQGATQQSTSSLGNGGGAAFSGVAAGGAAGGGGGGGVLPPTQNMGAGRSNGGGGAHRGQGPISQWADTPWQPGQRVQNAWDAVPAKGQQVFKTMGAASLAFTATHEQSMTDEQSAAARIAPTEGGATGSTYRGMFGRNFTSMGDQDRLQAGTMLADRSGFSPTSRGFQKMRTSGEAISALNPNISNVVAQTGNLALQAPATFNKMSAIGFQPKGGVVNARSIANKLIADTGGIRRFKEIGQLDAEMGPAGSLSVSIASMVSNGFLPPEAQVNVEEEIRGIIKTHIGGMSFKDYSKNMTAITRHRGSDRGDKAHDALKTAGIDNSSIANLKGKAGLSHESEKETIGGFTDMLKGTTVVLENFRGALTGILEIGPLGWLTGASSGVTSAGGGMVGSLINKVTGGLIGGMAPQMSSSQYSGGRAHGGTASVGQSKGGTTASAGGGKARAGSGGGGGGKAGLTFIAPRPGINSMSKEQDYGPRTIGQGFHTGIDLEGNQGASIKASAAGTVIGAGWGAGGDSGYGNVVIIDHGGGFKTLYCHMQNIGVSRGASVRQGQGIGGVGATGHYAQGSHLHFELHINNKHVDPVPYLNGRRGTSNGAPAATAGGAAGSGTGAAVGTSEGTNNAGVGSAYSEAAALGLGANGIMAGGGGGGGGGGAGSGATGSTGKKGQGTSAFGLPGKDKYSTPGTKSWVDTAAEIIGQKFGIKVIHGVGSRPGPSDHPKGLALDFMTGSGQGLADWVVANQKKLNVEYAIWNQKIWSDNNPSWKGMEDRGSNTANHKDHVHVSFESTPTNKDIGKDVITGGGGGGSAAQNRILGRTMAAKKGWTGNQWNALNKLWNKESGWRTNADNPTSAAYGIPQAMTSAHDMPPGYMTDPSVQIAWGLNYIADRYGNPNKAWEHSRSSGWYDKGAWNLSQDETARVHKGEMIIPEQIAEGVRNELTGSRKGRGGGVNITFSPGSVVVQMSGSVTSQEAWNTGKRITDAIFEDQRMMQLVEGN